MRSSSLLRWTSLSLLTALTVSGIPSGSFAASGDTTETTFPVTIEQDNPTGMVAKWTLLSTTHEELIGNLVTQQIQIPAGQYTFFIEQPKGYSSEVKLYDGDTVVKTSNNPQLNFTLTGSMVPRIRTVFKLAYFGQVGVTSDPAGIRYKLQGPNQFSIEAVTPHVYEQMPIGQYNVQYYPEGCPVTPAKSDELKKDSRISLNVVIKCTPARSSSSSSSSLAAAQQPASPKTVPIGPTYPFVTVTAGGVWLMFRDVALEAWFAPAVKEIAELGIMSGYKDDEGRQTDFFGPENWVTLQETAKAIQTAVGVPVSSNVEPENWYAEEWSYPYIAQAEQLDWLVYQDVHNDVTEQATRAEVVATILQAFDVPLRWPKGNVFSDVGRRDEYAAAIETGAYHGIVAGRKNENGTLTGEFDPEGWINRAEFAKILAAAIKTFKK